MENVEPTDTSFQPSGAQTYARPELQRLGFEPVVRTLSWINRWSEKIYGSILTLVLLGITFFLTGNVVGRYVFHNAFAWAEEITNYSIIWVTWLGSALAVRKGATVSVDILQQYLRGRPAAALQVAVGVLALCFAGAMIVIGSKQVVNVIASGQLTPAMRVPMYIPYMAIPAGGVFIGLEYLELLLNGFKTEELEEIDLG